MLKKMIYAACILILLLASGCQNNNKASDASGNNIQIESLGAEADDIVTLKAGGIAEPLVFELQSDDSSIREIEYWVDYYENGEFVKQLFKMSSSYRSDKPSKNRLYFSIMPVPELEKEIWTVTFREGKAVLSTGRYMVENKESNVKLAYPLHPAAAKKGETVNLAVRVENSTKAGSSADVEEAIRNNEIVYVMRCKLL